MSTRRYLQATYIRIVIGILYCDYVAWFMPHKLIFCFCWNIFHHGTYYGYSTTHAPFSRGFSTAKSQSNLLGYCFLRSTTWFADRSFAFWYSNTIHYLANNLLVFLRCPISYLHPSLLFHARLPKHQSGIFQLLLPPTQYYSFTLQTSPSSSSIFNRLLHLHNLHLLLDNPHIPPLLSSLLLLPRPHWSLRPHRHRHLHPRPHLLPYHHR